MQCSRLILKCKQLFIDKASVHVIGHWQTLTCCMILGKSFCFYSPELALLWHNAINELSPYVMKSLCPPRSCISSTPSVLSLLKAQLHISISI